MRSSGKFLPILVAGLMLGACDDGSPETGRLVINLTDAPGDLAEAQVKIREIILIGAEGDESAEGRVVLTPQVTDYIDLLTYDEGNVLELFDASGSTGIYSELRLVIDEAYVKLTDDRVFATAGAEVPAELTVTGTLRCPSCSSSGFKVKFLDGGLDVQENAAVLIDFDVAQSFGHDAGQSGAWVMHPVLRATSETIQLATISGTVSLGANVALPMCGATQATLAHFKPTATMGDVKVVGTSDAAGAFSIYHLMPGSYTLGNDPVTLEGKTLTFTATASEPTPNLVAGEVRVVNYAISAATCQ